MSAVPAAADLAATFVGADYKKCPAPEFANYVAVGDTWEEDIEADEEIIPNAKGEDASESQFNKRWVATGDLIVKSTGTPLKSKSGTTLLATYKDVSGNVLGTFTWRVDTATQPKRGDRVMRQSVRLVYKKAIGP